MASTENEIFLPSVDRRLHELEEALRLLTRQVEALEDIVYEWNHDDD